MWGAARDVEARTRSAAGVLGELQVLSDTGQNPSVAMNAGGMAVAVWRSIGDQPQRIKSAVGP